MTPRDLCYWLQGWFELEAAATGVNSPAAYGKKEKEKAFKCITAHIALIRASGDNYNSDLTQFIGWLESAIEFDAPLPKIQEKLSSVFEHVIDPMTPDTDGSQAAAHQGWGSGNIVARC